MGLTDLIGIGHARFVTPRAYGVQTAMMLQAFQDTAEGRSVRALWPRPDLPERELAGVVESRRRSCGIRNWPEPTFLPTLDLTSPDTPQTLRTRAVQPAALAMRLLTYARSVGRWLGPRLNSGTVCLLRDVWLSGLLGLRLGPEFRRSCVVEVHGLSGNPVRRTAQLTILRGLAGAVVLNPRARDILLQAGLAPERVLCAPSGADIRRFAVAADRNAARRRIGLATGRRYALYFGQFETLGAEKGLVDLLAKAGSALRACPDLDIVLAGGPERLARRYRETFRGLGLSEARLILPGRIDHALAPDWLAAADVLLLPVPAGDRRYADFASPLKVAEYAASGRPVAGSADEAVAILRRESAGMSLSGPWDWRDRAVALWKFFDRVRR